MPAAAPAPEHAEPLLMQVSVFRFQCSGQMEVSAFLFFFLTPDTRHLKPEDLVLGI